MQKILKIKKAALPFFILKHPLNFQGIRAQLIGVQVENAEIPENNW